jgi:hypothetical protein
MDEHTNLNPNRAMMRNWLEIIAITLVVLAIGVRAYGTVLSSQRAELRYALTQTQERLDACLSASSYDQCGALKTLQAEAEQALQLFDTPVRNFVVGLALNERRADAGN